MNRQLAQTVIAAFREAELGSLQQRLRSFSPPDWKRSFYWLDTSGLALYFLERVKALGLEQYIPHGVLLQLEQRLADNKTRTAALFEEFCRINRAFQNAGLEYLNLKGFTLVPDYCPDLSLRYQIDLDFLISGSDATRCRTTLESLGYVVTLDDKSVMECKRGAEHIPSLGELYKPKPQWSAEIHLLAPGAHAKLGINDGALERRRTLTLNGFAFPALSAEDMFLAQAAHVFRHVRSEWTRTSWLLEFNRFLVAKREDGQFWGEVRAGAMDIPDSPLAVAVSTRLVQKAFGTVAACELTDWISGLLPRSVCLWIERYGESLLLSKYPGTKLYLLLEQQLAGDASPLVRRRLFPLHRPTRIAFSSSAGFVQRFKVFLFQLRYFWFRLRFHITESTRYLLESRRWKRLLDAGSKDSSSTTLSSCHSADRAL